LRALDFFCWWLDLDLASSGATPWRAIKKIEELPMKKAFSLLSSFVLVFAFTAATAAAQTASWRQIVGIIPSGNVVGSGTGAVPGGFLPWTTTAGAARVDLQNGEIQFSVRGLVFAGGAPGITIGTPGPITGVKGTLVCDVDGSASGGNSVLVETPSVRLSSTGDAAFSGRVGTLPAVCSSERDVAFLVRASVFGGNSVEGPWIANGAVLSIGRDDRDDDRH
jgi:hypothetical protein